MIRVHTTRSTATHGRTRGRTRPRRAARLSLPPLASSDPRPLIPLHSSQQGGARDRRARRARGPGPDCAAARWCSGASLTPRAPGDCCRDSPTLAPRFTGPSSCSGSRFSASRRLAHRPGPGLVPRRPWRATHRPNRARDPHAAVSVGRRTVLALPARRARRSPCRDTAPSNEHTPPRPQPTTSPSPCCRSST